MSRAIPKQELKQYLEAEKQEIARKYGRCDDETMEDFVKRHGPEKFRDKYFKRRSFDR